MSVEKHTQTHRYIDRHLNWNIKTEWLNLIIRKKTVMEEVLSRTLVRAMEDAYASGFRARNKFPNSLLISHLWFADDSNIFSDINVKCFLL